MGVAQALGVELPDPFPPLAMAAYQAGVGQDVEVLRDRLAGDGELVTQTGDGEGSPSAERDQQRQTRPVAQGGEEGGEFPSPTPPPYDLTPCPLSLVGEGVLGVSA